MDEPTEQAPPPPEPPSDKSIWIVARGSDDNQDAILDFIALAFAAIVIVSAIALLIWRI